MLIRLGSQGRTTAKITTNLEEGAKDPQRLVNNNQRDMEGRNNTTWHGMAYSRPDSTLAETCLNIDGLVLHLRICAVLLLLVSLSLGTLHTYHRYSTVLVRPSIVLQPALPDLSPFSIQHLPIHGFMDLHNQQSIPFVLPQSLSSPHRCGVTAWTRLDSTLRR